MHPYLAGYEHGQRKRPAAIAVSDGMAVVSWHLPDDIAAQSLRAQTDYRRGFGDGFKGKPLTAKWRVLKRYPDSQCVFGPLTGYYYLSVGSREYKDGHAAMCWKLAAVDLGLLSERQNR